jgi:hypothetical protein
MRKLVISILAISMVIFLTSCAVFTSKGRAARAEEEGRAKIVNVDSRINANIADKMDAIASLAYGTDYALSKINEPSREVIVARDMNKRVESLAGSPTLDQMKEMQATIDKLTSILATEREEGKLKLSEKDQLISNLQNEAKALNAAKESEIRRYMNVAQEAAAAADAYKTELAEYQGWFGLKAVGKGLWQFVKSAMWILGIGGILFIILRMMSYSNPVVASIFSIFSTIASWFIRGIEALVPRAVEAAGHTANKVFNAYKSTLWKIVDNIQVVKDRATATGKSPNLDEVLDEVSKAMNSDEKEIVNEIKKALQWK